MNLTAVGMVCPIGLYGKAGCAALRAGVSGFRELPYWDRENAPVLGAAVPGLEDRQFGPRLVALLARALKDCLSDTTESSWRSVPLLVGLAEPGRPGGMATGAVATDIIALVQDELGIQFHPTLSRAIPKGHTAGFEGLRIAREIFKTANVPGCLVSGVDSYINASAIYWLDQNSRLKRENHLDGVIPGEAAAALFVQRRAASSEKVEVVGLGFGREKASLLSEEPLLGLGLADAGRQALTEAGWGFHDLDFRLSDVTGESYGFREHTLAEARLVTKVRVAPQPIWHVADSIGDTGAAAGLVQLAVACAAMRKGYAPGPRVLCFTSALHGDRAVAAVQGSPA